MSGRAPCIASILKEFSEEIEVLGLKYVCRENIAIYRRILYLFLVLFGVVFAGYQVLHQIGLYLQWPVNVRTNISYVDVSTFPKVVLCNGNQVCAVLSPFVPVDLEFLASYWPMTGVCT